MTIPVYNNSLTAAAQAIVDHAIAHTLVGASLPQSMPIPEGWEMFGKTLLEVGVRPDPHGGLRSPSIEGVKLTPEGRLPLQWSVTKIQGDMVTLNCHIRYGGSRRGEVPGDETRELQLSDELVELPLPSWATASCNDCGLTATVNSIVMTAAEAEKAKAAFITLLQA